MKIYSDPLLNVFYIETVSTGPVTDYFATKLNDTISIYRPVSGIYDLKDVSYTLLSDKSGNPFASAFDAITYITAQLKVTYPTQAPSSTNGLQNLSVTYPLSFDGAVISLDLIYITDGGNA